MDPNLKPRDDATGLLSRRRVLTLGLTAAAGFVVLPGCGGGGGGSRRTDGADFVSVSGTVTLPPGLPATGLTFLSGGTETGVGGRIKARVLEGPPSLVSVVENGSGRVVLLGMIDPSAGGFALDAANVAATLLFLAFGGGQETPEDRHSLWTALAAAPATATLAGVVASRLAADPFALENADATLLAAIQDTLDTFGGRSRSRTARKAMAKRPPSRAEVLRPTPAVLLDLDGANASLLNGAVGHGRVGNDVVPDLLSITNLSPLDTAFYAYHTEFSGGTPQSASLLVGPIVVPASRPALTEFGPIAIGLQVATDSIELMALVGLSPVFNAPAAPALSDPLYAAEAAGWQAQLADLWQRAVAQLAADIAYDALGWRQAELSSPALATVVANLNAVGGTQPGMVGAAEGTDFAGNVDLLTDFASSNSINAGVFLEAIQALSPRPETPSPFRLAQMRGVLRIAKLDGLFTAAANYGRIYAQSVYSSEHEAGPTVLVLNGHSIKRLILEIKPASSTYTPGGSLDVTVSDQGIEYLEPYAERIVYRWKVFGAGTNKITDGTKVGTEFESARRTVTLTTGSNASGVITVSAEAVSTAGGKSFTLAKASGSVNSGAGTRFALSPVESHALIGGSGGWTVTRDGIANMSGWAGIDPNHVRFRWELASSDHGRLGVSSPTGAVVETTTNAVQYFPHLNAQDGRETDLTCTVSLVDPSTGDFTNLAVLTGKAIADVRSRLQFQIASAGFPLSDLRFPDTVRMLESKSATFNGSDENGAYVGATYARPGSTTVDFLSLVFRSGAGFAEASQVTVDLTRSGITLATVTGVPPFDAAVVSATGAVLEAVRNVSGGLTFLKIVGALTFAESGGRQRTLTANFTGGFGTPPY